MRLFKRGLSEPERDAALRLIRHLQKMYAYQQLTMELYNDAHAQAGLLSSGGENIGHPTIAGATSNNLILEFVIPALESKRQILHQMDAEHAAFGRPALKQLRPAYDDFTHLLPTMHERTNAQYDGYVEWIADIGSVGVDTSALDRAERRAVDASIVSLNSLIAQAGVNPDGWFDICCDATNTIRHAIGLGPLTSLEYRTRYIGEQMAGSARFFRD